MSVTTKIVSSSRTIFVGVLLLLSTACTPLEGVSRDSAATNTASSSLSNRDIACSKYIIGVGDQLVIKVEQHPDLNVSVPVRRDGMISIPLAGEVDVGDRSINAAKDAVTQKLEEHFVDPLVTIKVENICDNNGGSPIRVTGAVQKPISTSYRQGITVLEAVLEAGGVDEENYLGGACLYRQDGSRLPIDLDHLLNRIELETNYILRPGDVVVVFPAKFRVESSANCLSGALTG